MIVGGGGGGSGGGSGGGGDGSEVTLDILLGLLERDGPWPG